MQESWIYRTDAWLICFIVFMLMLLMVYIGYKLHQKRKTDTTGLGPVEASLFGLLGLLLAFTFGMAGSRFDSRRTVIVEEANNIGTAVLRTDMYNDSMKAAFKKDFAPYIEARIAYYEAGRDTAKVNQLKIESDKYAALLWSRAATLSKEPSNLAASNQMVPALNAMMDVTIVREAALKARVPDSIVLLLIVMLLVCSFFAGFALPLDKKVEQLTIIGFALFTVAVMFVILDLDRPRRGLINLDANQQYMKDLRKLVQ